MYAGWVTKETDEMIVLSQGRVIKDDDDEYDGHMHIMKNCITNRRTISINPKPKRKKS